MKNKKTFIVLAVLIAVLMLGIGYAAVSNITLNIKGSATANPDDKNFVVQFDADTAVGVAKSVDSIVAEGEVIDAKNAEFTVSNLTAKGDNVTFTYTVENLSPDLEAELSVKVLDGTQQVTNNNAEYFAITPTVIAPTTIDANGGKTTVTVKVELVKTPIDAEKTANFTVTLDAAPVQPTA